MSCSRRPVGLSPNPSWQGDVAPGEGRGAGSSTFCPGECSLQASEGFYLASLILIGSIHLTPTALACPVDKGLELGTPGAGPEGLGCEIFGSGALSFRRNNAGRTTS